MSNSEVKSEKFINNLIFNTAIGCLVETCICPFSTVKVRLQMQGECARAQGVSIISPYTGAYQTFKIIIENEGFKSLYNGYLVGCTKRMLHYGFRFGSFSYLEKLSKTECGSGYFKNYMENPVYRMLIFTTTDMFGIAVSQPIRTMRIRFQCDSGKKFSLIKQEMATIYKFEGLKGFWRGLTPCLLREVLKSNTQIFCYISFQKFFSEKDNIANRLIESAFSSFLCVIFTNPFDVIKNRMIISEAFQYKNTRDCALKIYRKNGIRVFYKGYVPYYYSFLIRNLVLVYFLNL